MQQCKITMSLIFFFILQLNCETDFVARNAKFVSLASQLVKECHQTFAERSDSVVSTFYCYSLYCDLRFDYLSLFPWLSLSLSSALSVCPAVKAYISLTMGWILMKLGESVGT